MAYTAVPTVTTGELWTAANQNTYLRDNMTALAATRSGWHFLQPNGAYNTTDTAAVDRINTQGVEMIDNKIINVNGSWRIPFDFSADMTCKAVVISDASGNMRWRQYVYWGAEGENYSNHSNDSGNLTTALTIDDIEILTSSSMPTLAAGDYISLNFVRVGDDVLDTIGDVVYFMGWWFEYTAANYG